MERECKLCGRMFIVQDPHQRYCSEQCVQIMNRIRLAKTYETKRQLKQSVKQIRKNRLDMLEPDDLLHYGKWQTKQTLKGMKKNG